MDLSNYSLVGGGVGTLTNQSKAPKNPTITAGTANTFSNQSVAPQTMTTAPTVSNTKFVSVPPQPSVSAEQMAQPPVPVTVPPPAVAPVPDTSTAQAVSEDNQQIIAAQTEEAKRLKELRDEYAGVLDGTSFQQMFQNELGGMMVPENLSRLQDVQLQLNKLAEQSGLAQVRIAGAAGQTLGQAGREVTQEQREAAVRSSALAAEASILQGNIETATNLAAQTVQYAYQDTLVKNQNLINQINSLQGVVDDQTAQLLTQEQRKYEQENFNIQQAMASVNSAVSSGFATADDVATMTALSGDPKAQKEYADKILAKGARTQYLEALAATRAAANAARVNAATEAQGEAAAKAVTAQTALDVIDVIKNNPLGMKAIAGSTGFGRTSFSTAMDAATAGFVGGTGVGAGVGSVVPGLGTVAGGAFGGVTGFIGGATVGTYAASKQRADVAAALGYLVNNETFAEMRRLKQSGVTFGSLTESERVAIGKSADALFSALEVDANGAVTGVTTSEENFQRLLNDFQAKQQQYLTEAQLVASGMSKEDYQAIQNLDK